jgi:transglutaminase-like putative cysteine protease
VNVGYADAGPGGQVRGRGPRTMDVRWIAGGDLGALQTLDAMRGLSRAALTDPAVIETAAAVVRTVTPRDQRGQFQALRSWLASRFRFLPDPRGVELLRTPRYMLDRIAEDGTVHADCDDAATLGAALALVIGLPARFVAVGFRARGPLSHVFTEVLTPEGWRELDVTRPSNRLRPVFARRVTREV